MPTFWKTRAVTLKRSTTTKLLSSKFLEAPAVLRLCCAACWQLIPSQQGLPAPYPPFPSLEAAQLSEVGKVPWLGVCVSLKEGAWLPSSSACARVCLCVHFNIWDINVTIATHWAMRCHLLGWMYAGKREVVVINAFSDSWAIYLGKLLMVHAWKMPAL